MNNDYPSKVKYISGSQLELNAELPLLGTKQTLEQHLLPLQHPQPPTHTKPGHITRHAAQPALATAGGQVHMQPRHVMLQEAFQEACREDVIGFAIQRALLDVGDFGIQRGLVIVVHREGAQPLAALLSGLHGLLQQYGNYSEINSDLIDLLDKLKLISSNSLNNLFGFFARGQ